MTAQARESLIYKGEEILMAAEPLSQYLKNRNIKFIFTSTACWRGYYGQWEIRDSKLYLIGLEAYIEGNTEVGLDYLFPNQNIVFANWFSGEIRIPQGRMLDYVHMGYASLYERDLILAFENGLLYKEYIVDNNEEYLDRLKRKEKQKIEQLEKEVKSKKKDKIITVISILIIAMLLIGTYSVVNNLIQKGTTTTYLISTMIVFPLILILGGLIYYFINNNEKKKNRAVTFMGINFLVFVFIGICMGVFYLIKWGTIFGYFTAALIVGGLLFLVFLAVRNRKRSYLFQV